MFQIPLLACLVLNIQLVICWTYIEGAKGLEVGLHGEQVGLGSIVAARLWKEALGLHDIIDPKGLKFLTWLK